MSAYSTVTGTVGKAERLNDGGKLIEHWDVLQQVPEATASGNDMFSQVS